MKPGSTLGPSIQDIEAAAEALKGRIVATPMLELNSARIKPHLPDDARVHMKLELFQQAGSFKARGVVLAIDALNQEQREAGVTAVSAGNHALAVSWGAYNAGLSAKVVMMKASDKSRVDGCKALGADVVLMDNVGEAFEEVDRLVREEGRTMLHPFESPYMTLGAATCGLEIARALPDLETMLIPVGGGGLISGLATAVRKSLPDCTIIGIEPFGADSMWQSFQTGQPTQLDGVSTIADSLGAPMSLPNSLALALDHVDEIVRIEDDDMRKTMRLLFESNKLIAEPACAATTAAAMGALKQRLAGQTVGVMACGSNISIEKFSRIIEE